jgi:ABC-type transport system involved in multi-copper enzyme maturation permease subunit
MFKPGVVRTLGNSFAEPMTFLPIVERELRERARWRSTYWIRGMAAFIATGLAAFVLMFVTATTLGAVGKVTLNVLAWMAFLFALVEGLRNTADALSAEKRDGTLGLLFLTDLKGYDVVLGKFIASSLSSFYALLAMVPALAIPVLLGGVTGGEFWRLVLALMNGLFFSLTAGTFVSCFSREERRAWTGTFVLIGLFVVVLPVLSASLNVPALRLWSPSTAFWLHDAARYAAAPSDYWRAIYFSHLVSWIWLAAASFFLPRVWQESGRSSRRVPRNPAQSRQARRRTLAINPVWWLMSRNTHQQIWLWAIVVLLALGGSVAWYLAAGSAGALWTIVGCAAAVHLGLAVWLAFEACHSFADARSSGAMELILSSPIPVRQILRGQHLALRQLFLGPVTFLISVEIALVAAQWWRMAQTGSSGFERVMLVLVLGFCIVWFVLDLFAVAEVGMWYGLISRSPTQALTRTVLVVLLLPLIVLPCCSAVGPGLMVAKSVIFFTWAQSKLETHFRRAATERYESAGLGKRIRRPPAKLRMPGDV